MDIFKLFLVSLALGKNHVFATNPIDDLSSKLSPDAWISTDVSSAPRWSDLGAPRPGYIVHVAEELDVAETVKYCNEHDLDFLAQSGGHGGATTFHLGDRDIIINLRGLNSASVSDDRSEIVVGGGALNSEYVEAAVESGVVVLSGGCNCVGVLGLTLGGGLSTWMNEYGMPVDNLISAHLVTATGKLIKVSKHEHPDLFWAIGGAGPNFGIITSATMKAHPRENMRLWTAQMAFSADKLEQFLDVLNSLELSEKMLNDWGFNVVEPGSDPVITAGLRYLEDDDVAAQAAFKPLFDLGPDQQTIETVEYARLNDPAEPFCELPGSKPTWLTGLKSLHYPTWQNVYDEFANYVAETNQTSSRVFVESYSTKVLREIGSEGASYPHRDINYYAFVQPVYEGAEFDNAAEHFGSKVRELWRTTDGFDKPRTYINFAHGDEDLEEIYGESLPRLRKVKKTWDPANRFNQWFPIV